MGAVEVRHFWGSALTVRWNVNRQTRGVIAENETESHNLHASCSNATQDYFREKTHSTQ
jgi:hypothetical protein